MIDATRLGGVVGDGAAGSAELVVEADAGCEGEEAEGYADGEVVQGAGSVAFEVEQVFAAEEDGLDPLPDWCEVGSGGRLVFAGWTDDGGAELGDRGRELASGVALVADDRFAAVEAAAKER